MNLLPGLLQCEMLATERVGRYTLLGDVAHYAREAGLEPHTHDRTEAVRLYGFLAWLREWGTLSLRNEGKVADVDRKALQVAARESQRKVGAALYTMPEAVEVSIRNRIFAMPDAVREDYNLAKDALI